MNKKYFNILMSLKGMNLFQFNSLITGSQYINAYKLVDKYVKPDSKILDWGAGNHHFTFFLLENGHCVVSYSLVNESEISEMLKKQFGDKVNIIVNPESPIKLPFHDQEFDVVTSIGVLEHVKESNGDELESLREIKRILKNNGIFICYHFPNKYSWIEYLSSKIKNKYRHHCLYSKGQIKKLVEDSGLKLLEIKRYGFLPRLTFNNLNANQSMADIFNITDTVLSKIFSIFCQSYLFVLQKQDQ